MVPKWMQTLVLLFFCHDTLQQSSKKKEGERVSIKCLPNPKGNMVIWFRVKENAGMEFIASFNSLSGQLKTNFNKEIYSDEQIQTDTLILKSFNKARDSGAYTCASIKNNELVFGEVTRMAGEDTPVTNTPTTPPTPTTNELLSSTTALGCKVVKQDPRVLCDLIIWAPLAAGCGLLFIILLITVSYCNRTRTKRCPHHYKRKLRMEPQGK
ncbi:hypothetical protein UPYG_G00161230 [Umbra pygmaea]|uniref:Ig-like domain-containing protein n=1 Tax=Umbra pygmaea TaxID=75934 RepID=A0ABD0X7R0_UMBPY